VSETSLPGVGVRHEFTTAGGERVGVICHRGGRREVLVYDKDDPDACTTILHLSVDDTRTLAELLGATQVSEALATVQQEIDGLAIDWIRLPPSSEHDGSTIADSKLRARSGASIVAVLRGDETMPAPGPDFQLVSGDMVVAVGRSDGLGQLRSILER
jgi:TrkA domain protein